ncbi:unnamed protein product [Rotaria sp. Silwood2]|nr:unnamed protein product [Rotaria sp. Silwood2]CAF2924123.1 unnamed protein product [Rotaria sp. Silwood2]CAF3414433.1 unnamed protein product [Rotaria sp. Silwood2]
MPQPTWNMDLTILPGDVLSLYGEPFYELVRKLAGPGEAKLLEIQGIRSAYSLINTEDIFDILNYPCKALNEVKTSICLLLDDNRYIIKAGCKSNLRYLIQLFTLKNQEHLKTMGARLKSKKSNDNDISNTFSTQSSAQVLPLSSLSSQQTTPADETNELKHRDFITRALDDWFNKNKANFNLSNEKFVENVDYKLTLVLNQASEEAFISCSCGVRVNLGKERRHFSLSNYYKHIKSTKCTMVYNRRKSMTNNRSNEENESLQKQISQTDVITSVELSSSTQNINNQSYHTSNKRKESSSSSDASRNIRHRSQ